MLKISKIVPVYREFLLEHVNLDVKTISLLKQPKTILMSTKTQKFDKTSPRKMVFFDSLGHGTKEKLMFNSKTRNQKIQLLH